MKTFKKLLKEQHGFTLVELMVVVAIIGVLSAVAVPNFKKYQAKAKTSEAKVQLAAAYTAEQAFYGDFGVYANCLAYMGYDPANEVASRYYVVGFKASLATLDTNARTTAINSGVGVECITTSGFVANSDGHSAFSAGKGVGGTAALTYANFNAATAVGTQATAAQTFTIGAQGHISTDKTSNTNNSVFLITEEKVMTNVRSGY